MIVALLVFLALLAGGALCAVFAEPWFDVRTIDWEKLGQEFGEGFSALRNEVDR